MKDLHIDQRHIDMAGFIANNGTLAGDSALDLDTIDHTNFWNKLENDVGISGSALAWCIVHRHQFAAVNEEVS